jgi:16S rRNA (adenine1518-N6/adenine1519-N6)-dimethyltransferase
MRSPQFLLKLHHLRPQKQRGQNFLVDPATAQMIVDRARLRPEDIVVEIGPGLGALTPPLARRAQAVIAIEKDRNLAEILGAELRQAGVDNVQVIAADVLQIDLAVLARNAGRTLTVVGNLPYNISSQIVVQLIQARRAVPRAVLMFQKELADRLRAEAGSRDYGRITAMLQYCAAIRPLAVVTAKRFFPSPRVDSELLEICFHEENAYPPHDEKRLFRVIAAAFGQRRKTLKNALSAGLRIRPETAGQALAQAGIDPARRAETLCPAEFVALEISLQRLALH